MTIPSDKRSGQPKPGLSRRERQIMDIIYQLGQATAMEIHAALPDPPSYSAVRALLSVMEEKKGLVRHTRDGARYVYLPTQSRNKAAQSALAQVVKTFFGGSIEQVVATLVSDADSKLSDEELDRLSELIEQAKEGGK